MDIKILVVDDERDITEMLKNYLFIEGYDVDTVNCPVEALKCVKSGDYAIVISDISMPEMSGLELLEQVKQHDDLIQVIMVSGYVTMSNLLQAFRKGASDIFFKPFEDMKEVLNAVKTCEARITRIHEVLKKISSKKATT